MPEKERDGRERERERWYKELLPALKFTVVKVRGNKVGKQASHAHGYPSPFRRKKNC